ncbi:MAG: 4Fe-4S binding protein [Geminicoccaceae bacterium]
MASYRIPAAVYAVVCLVIAVTQPIDHASAKALSEENVSALIVPPYQLGAKIDDRQLWHVLNAGGKPVGYAFETAPLAPIPGFSGQPVNLLISLDLDGQFLDVIVLAQNEPVFVSGLGPAPLNGFVRQYRGRSIADNITVGVPYGDAATDISTHVYLDGVSKATASVRIVNETVLAAALKVAREYLEGAAPRAAKRPRTDLLEKMSFDQLLASGLVSRLVVTNRKIDAAFEGSLWAADDPDARADPDGIYLELYVADLGIPSVARSLIDEETQAAIDTGVRDHEEPLLVMARGRHQLLEPDFVRNTAPDRIGVRQDGYPISVRDADIEVILLDSASSFDQMIMLRLDTRLGFDPGSTYELYVRAVRDHGMFMPERGTRDLTLTIEPPARFFAEPIAVADTPIWISALSERRLDLLILAMFAGGLFWLLLRRQSALAAHPMFRWLRLATLVAMTVFVGWYGQGQLSIVTPLAALNATINGGSFWFLLYDPFSLLLWAAVLISLLIWGRGFFCGWLCPYGALQEISHRLGRWLRLPDIALSDHWDRRLKWLKYGVLGVLIIAALTSAAATDALVEVEPFKTAITLGFVRDWPFVAYAVLWLVLGMVLFKGFCRYVCPLGALLALGGRLRRLAWIDRRQECGSPCQLCKVRCQYQAIEPNGRVDYDECFQCLDCVTIYEDEATCVPLVLEQKRRARLQETAA